jgi:sarcosine oxidase
MANSYDVIVLGLGGMGSAAAYHLASRGQRVLGLEKFQASHNRGSSHGDSRIIRQAYHEHPNYVPLARRSFELWRRLEQDASADILRQTGGLMIGQPASSVVEGALLSAREHNLAHEIWDAREIQRRFPVLHPRPDEMAVYETGAGFVKPEAAIEAHLRLAARHSAELHFEEPVTAWSASASGDSVTVKTPQATYQAGRLVIAPGAWAPDLLADLQISFDVQRHVMCWFDPLSSKSSFQPDSFPIYIWDVDGTNCFYGLPATGGISGVKAAMHSGGVSCTAETVDRTIHETDIAEVRGWLAKFIPALNGPLTRAVSCLYTMTADQHFVVDLHPRYPQVSIAAGFSGHGFKFTSVMGEILADLATEGRTMQPVGFLSAVRFVSSRTLE